MKNIQCPSCGESSMKRIDTRKYRSDIQRLYECFVCKDRYMSLETFQKKCNSLEFNNRKYK